MGLRIGRCSRSSLGIVATNIAWAEDKDLVWQDWNAELFTRAQAEQRFVLLDLEAVWCHWCHVMDQETYSDPKVIAALKKNYITVQVDQDSRPDLANRYEQYGWPATIIFGPDGTEIVKRRGFVEPDVMLSILEEVRRRIPRLVPRHPGRAARQLRGQGPPRPRRAQGGSSPPPRSSRTWCSAGSTARHQLPDPGKRSSTRCCSRARATPTRSAGRS